MNKIAIIKDSGNLKSFKVIFFDTFQTLCWLSIKNNQLVFVSSLTLVQFWLVVLILN